MSIFLEKPKRIRALAVLLPILALMTFGNSASASAKTAAIVLRVKPARFASYIFVLYNGGSERFVKPGVISGIALTFPHNEYDVSFRDSAYSSDEMHMTVSGPNIKVLHQGGPHGPPTPWFEITGPGSVKHPAVVTLTISGPAQPVTSTTNVTTTTPPSTTSTAPG